MTLPLVRVIPHGPYEINGLSSVTVLFARSRTDVTVGTLGSSDTARVCRCGRSGSTPVCDNSCSQICLDVPAAANPPEMGSEPGVSARPAFVVDGPLMAAGVTVVDPSGVEYDLTDRECAMCR